MGVMSGCRRVRKSGNRLGLKSVGLDEMINHKCAEFDEVVAVIEERIDFSCVQLVGLWE